MITKKILITGGTGYIGNYITKMLAATRPETLIYSLSRRPVDKAKQRDLGTSRFENVRFI
jgi:nucleoside-diphosphate-sugar epimerase